MSEEVNRFADLSYDDFRRMATDKSLSRYEKIGFPDNYRAGKEEAIFADILNKLPGLQGRGKLVMDIGPGCSDLPRLITRHCEAHEHRLVLIDSDEMLGHLPDEDFIEKVPAVFPDCPSLVSRFQYSVDLIICYSVFHYVFAEHNIWQFLDTSLQLLAPGGAMLIGDIPNVSKRKRFFSSEAGVKFHQEFMKTSDLPDVQFNCIEHGQIDDAVLDSLVMRARAQGVDAYLMPQESSLPMSNRREDLLLVKP